ncbi:MAG: hypothetical protein P8J33_18275, partial [Pirellulaceae bacterium]|nr:hypothetical protein [Pirellulaceae bacterium]
MTLRETRISRKATTLPFVFALFIVGCESEPAENTTSKAAAYQQATAETVKGETETIDFGR